MELRRKATLLFIYLFITLSFLLREEQKKLTNPPVLSSIFSGRDFKLKSVHEQFSEVKEEVA